LRRQSHSSPKPIGRARGRIDSPAGPIHGILAEWPAEVRMAVTQKGWRVVLDVERGDDQRTDVRRRQQEQGSVGTHLGNRLVGKQRRIGQLLSGGSVQHPDNTVRTGYIKTV